VGDFVLNHSRSGKNVKAMEDAKTGITVAEENALKDKATVIMITNVPKVYSVE